MAVSIPPSTQKIEKDDGLAGREAWAFGDGQVGSHRRSETEIRAAQPA